MQRGMSSHTIDIVDIEGYTESMGTFYEDCDRSSIAGLQPSLHIVCRLFIV